MKHGRSLFVATVLIAAFFAAGCSAEGQERGSSWPQGADEQELVKTGGVSGQSGVD